MDRRTRNNREHRTWRRIGCLFMLLLVPVLLQGRAALAGERNVAPAAEQTVSPLDVLKLVADNRGKVVMINFFASWCGPCVREVPMLRDLRGKYSPDDLVIVGISVDESQAAYERFVNIMEITYPTYRARNDVVASFGISSIPTIIYCSRDGAQDRVVGLERQQAVEERLADLMGKE